MMTLPTEEFVQQFENELDQFGKKLGAKETLERLEKAGVTRFVLLIYLEMYCRLEIEIRLGRDSKRAAMSVAAFVESKRLLAIRAEKLSQRLSDDADEIERIDSEFDSEFDFAHELLRSADAVAVMRDYISRLKPAAERLRKRWGHSFREEPGEILAFLADHIKSVTREDHFADLALLLQVAYSALGEPRDRSSEDVRKIVARGRKRRKMN
jgi:hypothetical protein